VSGEVIDGADFASSTDSPAFDFVIVGSGAAGATAARVLVDTGATVAVVEEGPAVRVEDFSDSAWPALRDLYRGMGGQTARGRGLIRVMQGSCLGGSTVVNSAIAWRMPEAVWREWDAVHGLGVAIPYSDLERNWETIERELRVQPTPREVWGGNNHLLHSAATRTGARAEPTNRYVAGCQGSARCQLGCPHRAKRSMLETYLPYAAGRGATIVSRARAEKVLIERDRAVGVVAEVRDSSGSGRQKRTIALHARSAVLVAASAIQTPGLLARSGVRSPQLGDHFQAHPGALILGVFDQPVNIWQGATQGYNVYHHLDDFRCKIETLSLPPELIFAQLPGIGRTWIAEIARSGRLASWSIVLRAHAEGSVRQSRLFGGTDIRYDLEPRDVINLRKGLRLAAELMFAAGAREVLPGVHGLPERLSSTDDASVIESGPDDPACYSLTTSHLFGTTRMSPRPSGGVVGPDFAVHGLRGLHVVDSSVFPTNLGVNPQHTIMAVAMHAAHRIAEEST
jgi:choline dehydrogenase-like flavoprotein